MIIELLFEEKRRPDRFHDVLPKVS
jgi:hypothetical protein